MIASILSLATANPPHLLEQEELAERFCQRLGLDEALGNKLRKIFYGSRIKKRYSALDDFLEGDAPFGENWPREEPCNLSRHEVYQEAAPKLALEAAKKAIQDETITHVISVSCTGAMAPGIELLLVEGLGLNPSVNRIGLNYMGCFGAIKGLMVAKALAEQDPAHRILLVCTELCTLHCQSDRDGATFVANALFGDGAAAVVVGQGEGLWEIAKCASRAIPKTEGEMTWGPTKAGFLMHLSPTIPSHFRQEMVSFVDELTDDPRGCGYAIHPGGHAILHGIKQVLQLDDHLDATYRILENYGNMSSPTVLFVLNELERNQPTIATAFGPGLSIEGVFLK